MDNTNQTPEFDFDAFYTHCLDSNKPSYYEPISARDDGGYITGHIVNRQLALSCRSFLFAMCSVSTECTFLADTILDAEAKLRQKWISGCNKGSGIWDSRLNIGDFLVIETVFKRSLHWEGGVSNLFSKILDEVKDKVQWIFIWPGRILVDGAPRVFSGRPKYRRANKEEKGRAVAFWRGKGFRRIGLSHWFCYAMAENDASRNLATNDDNYDSVDEADVEEGYISSPTDSQYDEDDEVVSPQGLAVIPPGQPPAPSAAPISAQSETHVGESDSIYININMHVSNSDDSNEVHPEEAGNLITKTSPKMIPRKRGSRRRETSAEQSLRRELEIEDPSSQRSNFHAAPSFLRRMEDEDIFIMEDL
ncbi:hypothetical protein DSL72_005035 [Monilinia vaccinii-corymbosi]|uniref:Uncharacterized protein n=1 Tax=Monilinia vaccinii-corymbosi TaxID=61207 RepID=A0A8A3PE36_9HELO|nr:hypothetical protein DSL72_005035 [Monilinia vaccinii-corymbosi]